MILFCFSLCRFSGRDYPNIEIVLVNFAESMMNAEKYSIFIQSKSYPTVFSFTVFLVFDGEHVGVKKNLRSALETDFVVSQVSSCFCWVPFKIVLHDLPPTAKSSDMAEKLTFYDMLVSCITVSQA